MKTRFSRLLATLLAVTLLLGCMPLAALAEDDVIVLTAACTRKGDGEARNDRALTKEVEERLGIRMDITDYTNEAWQTQLTLLMAEDNLPDLLLEQSLSRDDVNRYGQEGYFLDLSKYLDIMPNFAAKLEEDAALNAYVRDEHGAIYGISKTRDSMSSRYVSMAYLNAEWLKNVGMEYPTTTEELYQVLKAFKEQDANGNGDPADEIPMSLTFDRYSGSRGEYVIRSAFGIYSYSNNLIMQVGEDNKVYLAEATENWKEYVKFMNRLYSEGLLDQDAFIQTNDEYLAKTLGDRLGLMASWTTLDRIFTDVGRKAYFDWHFFTGVTSDMVDEVVYPLYNPVSSSTVMMVSADCSNPEAACKLIDYFYTLDGIILANYGTPGKNFDWVEGYEGINGQDYTGYWENSGYTSASDYKNLHVIFGNTFQFLQYAPEQAWVDAATDEELAIALKEDASMVTLIDAYKEAAVRKVSTTADYPMLVYKSDEGAERATLRTDIQTYIQTMKAQFIIGEADIDKDWDTFINTLNAMGLERLLQIEQAAYDRTNTGK